MNGKIFGFEKEYFEDYYRYSEKREHIVAKNMRALQWSNRYVNVDLCCGKKKSALDVGCAYGYMVDFLLSMGYEAVGIDISLHATKGIRSMFQKPSIVLCDVQKTLPFHRKFNLITCLETVEHLQDPSRAISSMTNALESGGVLIVTTPDRDFILRRILDHDPTHINVDSLKNWKRKFEMIVKDGEVHVDPFPPFIQIPQSFLKLLILRPLRVGVIITVIKR